MLLITLHCAPTPHEPGHGSLHFSLMEARLLLQSEFIEDSGWQFGGDPRYDGKHEQDGIFPTGWHIEWGPQGDGIHGITGGPGFVDVGSSRNLIIAFYDCTITVIKKFAFYD